MQEIHKTLIMNLLKKELESCRKDLRGCESSERRLIAGFTHKSAFVQTYTENKAKKIPKIKAQIALIEEAIAAL